MAMLAPPNPGSILKIDVLPNLGIGVTEAAAQLGVSRETLSRVLNGRRAISTDMAIRLEAWINGPTAETWLRLQAEYDIWVKRKEFKPTIEKLKGPPIEIDLGDKNTQNPNICRAERSMLSSIGLQLKNARKLEENLMTLEEAANRLGISKSDLKRFESGLHIESIPMGLIKNASFYYGVSVDYLFGLNEELENTESARGERDTLRFYDKITSDICKKQIKLEKRIESISKSFLELVKVCMLTPVEN